MTAKHTIYVAMIVSCLSVMAATARAAEFVCEPDVETSELGEGRQFIASFWNESLIYLAAYLRALETPTGACESSAEAMVETGVTKGRRPLTRCILASAEMAAVAKHVKAILAEPDKARACFDAQRNYHGLQLFTPSTKVRGLTQTSKWINRPLLSDYYQAVGGDVGAAGRELSEGFLAITAHTASSTHWPRDVSINGLPTVWSSVGWIPMYAENQNAGGERFRGGYIYAELMGPWGNLRIKSIDGEPVGAEIGMTVQLGDTYYPYHFHHPQEAYMVLTEPSCEGQFKMMLVPWNSKQIDRIRNAQGWQLTIDGSHDKWNTWFAEIDPENHWLTYSERNEIHAFYSSTQCAQGAKPSGLVTVWSRATARDNEQATRLCRPLLGHDVKGMMPWKAVSCDLRDWMPPSR